MEKVIERKLTDKQELFCIEYVLNKGNAAEAARRAGYSENNDFQTGYDNLRNPYIISRIAQLREDSGVKTGANVEWLTSVLVSAIESSLRNEDSKGVAMNSTVLMKLMGWEGAVSSVPIEKLADRILEQRKAMKTA